MNSNKKILNVILLLLLNPRLDSSLNKTCIVYITRTDLPQKKSWENKFETTFTLIFILRKTLKTIFKPIFFLKKMILDFLEFTFIPVHICRCAQTTNHKIMAQIFFTCLKDQINRIHTTCIPTIKRTVPM